MRRPVTGSNIKRCLSKLKVSTQKLDDIIKVKQLITRNEGNAFLSYFQKQMLVTQKSDVAVNDTLESINADLS